MSTQGRARRAHWLGGFSLLACALALVAIVGLIRSLLAMTYLNIRFADAVDPLSRALSYYVFVARGSDVFAVTLVVLAVATMALLAGMAQLRVRLGVPGVTLFATWSVGLLLCAAFPTDNSGHIESVHGLIHQFAGASLFVTLPLAGLYIARALGTQQAWRATARVVRGLSFTAVGFAIGYLIARLPDLVPWLDYPSPLDVAAVSGLIQRGLFALEITMLLVLAGRLLRVSWSGIRAGRAIEDSSPMEHEVGAR